MNQKFTYCRRLANPGLRPTRLSQTRLGALIALIAMFAIGLSGHSPLADARTLDGTPSPLSTIAESETGPSYRVDLTQALTRYVTVTMTAESEGDETQLMMPTWTPGSYLIREYAKHIDRIAAQDSEGNPLKIEKISKNRWRVDTREVERFEVSYRLFCDEVSVRTNSVNFNRAVLNGAPTFLSIPEQHDRAHRIKLILPKNWSVSSSSLRRGRGDHNYQAQNYDEVVDSPIVAGNVVVYPFEVAGVPHFLVNVGQSNDWDSASAIEDIRKLVEQHQRMWGEVPYDRYHFITVFGGNGGLEHDNGCLMMVPRLDTRDRSSYRSWLRLASHEFFHTWNIRRLRPKELVKYDYENETYTPSLWIAEGTTSYYEDLLLARAGLVEKEQFLQMLNGSIQQLQRTEGRLVQSLRDSSHDAWIKFYRPESNSSSTQISYYTKGAIVSMLLDIRIRVATQGKKSLDDVLRLLWTRHHGETGYRETDFRELCNEVAGTDLSEWFAQSVDSTAELDYQELANWMGLEIGNVKPISERSEGRDTEENLDEEASPSQTNLRRWIGVGEFDSPATKAGLADTDEVIAINGKRVSSSELETEAQAFEVNQPVKILVARDGLMEEILLVVGSRAPAANWALKVAGRTTREQRKNLRDWIAPLTEMQTTSEPTSSEAPAEPAPESQDSAETPAADDATEKNSAVDGSQEAESAPAKKTESEEVETMEAQPAPDPKMEPNPDPGKSEESPSIEAKPKAESAVAGEDKPKEDKPKEDKPKEDKPKEDKPKEDKPKEDKPKEDKPKEDKPKEDKPKEDKPKEDKPKEDKPKEDKPEKKD